MIALSDSLRFSLKLFGVDASLDVQVTVRGKKYDISGVTTVKELQAQLQKESGVEPSQHTILFGGKRLEDDDVLSDAGVEDGAQLSVIPRISKSKPKTKKAKTSASASPQMKSDTKSMLEDYMKNSGIDTSKLDEMMKSMGGGNGEIPDMQESLKQMSSMMNSPVFQEFMNDPENLEKSRQMILNNPMLKGMMSGMPGMDELLNDPVAWREAMMAAANMYKNMDPEDLMKAMGGGQPGGLFDGNLDPSSLAAAKALDELDEDDD